MILEEDIERFLNDLETFADARVDLRLYDEGVLNDKFGGGREAAERNLKESRTKISEFLKTVLEREMYP